MDIVGCWSERIATRVAPAEVDFAADVGLAFAAGGGSRADLFARSGTEPGGFGLSAVVGELPVILRALADLTGILRHLLAARELGNLVAIASLLLSIHQTKAGSSSSPEDEGEGALLRQAYVSLRGKLLHAGFPSARAEDLTYALLDELLTDAASAEEFLRRLDGDTPGTQR